MASVPAVVIVVLLEVDVVGVFGLLLLDWYLCLFALVCDGGCLWVLYCVYCWLVVGIGLFWWLVGACSFAAWVTGFGFGFLLVLVSCGF